MPPGAGTPQTAGALPPAPAPNLPAVTPPPQFSHAPTAPPTLASIVLTALGFRGTPYVNGGSDPRGFDCSGLIQFVFGQHGVALPREVREQFQAGRKIHVSDLRPGDLVFFHTSHGGPSHVGLAIGGDQFVHAPTSQGVVRVERLSLSYWTKRFIGARRIG